MVSSPDPHCTVSGGHLKSPWWKNDSIWNISKYNQGLTHYNRSSIYRPMCPRAQRVPATAWKRKCWRGYRYFNIAPCVPQGTIAKSSADGSRASKAWPEIWAKIINNWYMVIVINNLAQCVLRGIMARKWHSGWSIGLSPDSAQPHL